MSTAVNTQNPWFARLGWLVVIVLAGGAIAWYTGVPERMHPRAASQERAEIYRQTVAEVAKQSAAWPQTESDLLREFWKCIASKNYKQAILYCPGSKESDYAAYSRMPTQPEITVGSAEPHPTAAGVKLWPMKVVFAGYGAKTIKLAVQRLPGGQLTIDGQHSIWW